MGATIGGMYYENGAGGTIGGVNYVVLNEGGCPITLDVDPKNRSIQGNIVYYIAWSDIGNFYNAIYYTAHPFVVGAYATSMSYMGFGIPTGTFSWKNAKVTVGYKNLPFDPTDFKEVSYTATGDIASIDKESVSFETSPNANPVPESPQVIVTTIDITVAIHQSSGAYISSVAPAATALIGQINDASFTADGIFTFAQDTVIYKGYDLSEKFMFGAVPTYEISHKFTAGPIDWRKKWSPVTGDYDKVTSPVSGLYLYTEGSFSGLSIPS